MEPKPQAEAVRGPALITLALLILAMPFGGGFPLTDDPYPHYRAVPWLDIAWLALILATLPLFMRRIRERGLGSGTTIWAVIVLLFTVSLAVTPSAIGAQTLLRAVGILTAGVVVAALSAPQRRFVLALLAIVVAFELGVAVAQVIAGGPVGILGESPGLSPIRGNAMVARGTFLYEYIYAGLGLVAAGLFIREAVLARWAAPWIALGALAITAVAITFSRTALVGLLAGWMALAAGAIRSASPVYRWALVALILGAALPGVALRDGWLGRAIEGAGPSQQAVTERVGLASQALTLIAERPIFGVGTGRYVAAARERFPEDPNTHSVHNVPLLIAAEAGVVAGILALTLGGVLGWKAFRGGPAALALYLLFVPALLVDVYPLITAQGTVLTGLWLGALDAVRTEET